MADAHSVGQLSLVETAEERIHDQIGVVPPKSDDPLTDRGQVARIDRESAIGGIQTPIPEAVGQRLDVGRAFQIPPAPLQPLADVPLDVPNQRRRQTTDFREVDMLDRRREDGPAPPRLAPVAERSGRLQTENSRPGVCILADRTSLAGNRSGGEGVR